MSSDDVDGDSDLLLVSPPVRACLSSRSARYAGMRPEATTVSGLKLLLYEALSY
jgi:hypothetical protein